jgi:hypothetical protein
MGIVARDTLARWRRWAMTVAEQERPAVAKKKAAGRPKGQTAKGQGVQIRLARDVVRMARIVTPSMGVTLTDYLSDILRPTVRQHYAKTIRELEKEGGEA